MIDFFRQNSFIIGALTGSLAAYLFRLLISYLRREKRILSYIISSRKIVERCYPKIDIRYDNKPIERLYSHKITIRNDGNRAIKKIPIKIKCDSGKFVEPI